MNPLQRAFQDAGNAHVAMARLQTMHDNLQNERNFSQTELEKGRVATENDAATLKIEGNSSKTLTETLHNAGKEVSRLKVVFVVLAFPSLVSVFVCWFISTTPFLFRRSGVKK